MSSSYNNIIPTANFIHCGLVRYNTVIQKVDQLKESYGYWTENHVEVPGFDHAHDHGHDHSHNHDHHHHGPGLEVSAADMLLIQKEFKDSIISIQKRILELKK